MHCPKILGKVNIDQQVHQIACNVIYIINTKRLNSLYILRCSCSLQTQQPAPFNSKVFYNNIILLFYYTQRIFNRIPDVLYSFRVNCIQIYTYTLFILILNIFWCLVKRAVIQRPNARLSHGTILRQDNYYYRHAVRVRGRRYDENRLILAQKQRPNKAYCTVYAL